MKYKVGDTVRIKEGLVQYEDYGDYHFKDKFMYEAFSGRELVVSDITLHKEYKLKNTTVIVTEDHLEDVNPTVKTVEEDSHFLELAQEKKQKEDSIKSYKDKIDRMKLEISAIDYMMKILRNSN